MKRTILILAALASLLSAPAALAATEHCPLHDHHTVVKDESGRGDNDLVPAAGLICVKAGNEATGVITSDGVTTLREYLKAAGIVGGDGEGRDVSYWVSYPFDETPPPSEEPTFTPSASATPTPSPSSDPSSTPTPTLEPTATPTPSATGSLVPPVTGENPDLTPPPTDTEPEALERSANPILFVGAFLLSLAAIGFVWQTWRARR